VILPRLAAHIPASDGRMETFSVWGSYINVSPRHDLVKVGYNDR
jgi:hypothetical protein